MSDAFSQKLLAATKAGAYSTADQGPLAGLSDAQLAAAAEAAHKRGATGYLVPLQNTTQQPVLGSLSVRATRETIFGTHGIAPNTAMQTTPGKSSRAWRSCVRSERQLLGFPSHAAWKLSDQMAKTPQAALDFMDALVPVATAKAAARPRTFRT